MKNENITVMLSTEATPELVSSLDPDAVIAALGSRPAVPTYLPGYDKANVMPAEYAYTHVNEVGNKVVVIGGGLVGAELALHLASCGKQVTIMHRHEQVKCGANGLHGQAISEQIRIHKVGTAFNTSPVEITDDGVIGKNAEGEKLYRGGHRYLRRRTAPACGRGGAVPLLRTGVLHHRRLCDSCHHLSGDISGFLCRKRHRPPLIVRIY